LCKETLENILKKLQIYGYTTDELIHQYYTDRLIVQQNATETSKYGTITMKCDVKDDILQVFTHEIEDLNRTLFIRLFSGGHHERKELVTDECRWTSKCICKSLLVAST
jgi:hypothetical protein